MLPRPASAFFDSQDLLLNLQLDHGWGNFGYWQDTNSYPVAAEQLAHLLGRASDLQPTDHLLDLGFGCGDQLHLWETRFGVRRIEGWNISRAQCAIARQKPYRSQVEIHEGDFFSKTGDSSRYDKVLALDCAYHFDTRVRFLDFAQQHLKPGGALGLVDISVELASATRWQRLAVEALSSLVRIPRANLSGATEMAAELDRRFEQVEWQKITPWVFAPFCDFLRQHHARMSAFVAKSRWRKYRFTCSALSYLCTHELLDMHLVVARTPRQGPPQGPGNTPSEDHS